jgi:hypothetical protein
MKPLVSFRDGLTVHDMTLEENRLQLRLVPEHIQWGSRSGSTELCHVMAKRELERKGGVW